MPAIFDSGDLIILIAQVVQAVQVVIEEKFVNGKDIHPLQAVGWEGKRNSFSNAFNNLFKFAFIQPDEIVKFARIVIKQNNAHIK